MTRTPPPTRLLDPREDEVVARLHRYATAGAPPMQLAADDVIRAAHRRTTARRARGAAVSTLTVAALALGGTYLAGLDHVPDDTPAVAGDVRVVTVAEGVTAASFPARVRGEANAVDLGLRFPDVPVSRAITLSEDAGTLYVDLPLDPGSTATGASVHTVRLDPWVDEEATATTFRTVASTDGREMLVVGTVPQWVDDPVVELVGEEEPGFVPTGGGDAVDRVQVPTFDAPGDGTGRVYAAVLSADSAASRGWLRIDDLRLVPVVTGAGGAQVLGGECRGEEPACVLDTVQGLLEEVDAATVEVADGITATARLGVDLGQVGGSPVTTPRLDLGLDLPAGAAPGRLAIVHGPDAPPATTTVPASIGIADAGPLPDSAWRTALGGSREEATTDLVSTTTAYAALDGAWVLTGTVPGSVDPGALARIELAAPVVRADGTRGTTIDVPTFDPLSGDGRRTYVVVVGPDAGLPDPASGESPLAPVPTTFVPDRL
ncbi:hypothetical protein [Cellulomonas cellasea]|uniref:Uncharacterized protein n=2 Tax=Cellulomonas cellasea TaxID=43670 RepID=A0A0A0B906_9CELL|nr:hypothetical protein [Cellulomonas cellasea]KGM01736.1 hypothetical protein Q760_17785 [Cellulomonas cellasea DSM 20118]GEA89251.1 hypothetical protein CCE01nite_32000 [Cellulomonas cellasea]